MSKSNVCSLRKDSGNLFDDSALIEPELETFKILTVEDDLTYQRSLVFSLRSLQVVDVKLEILQANSRAEAEVILQAHNDIGLIFIDVVMEQDDAGLRLIERIRHEYGNKMSRIVLLTGQPGVMPQGDIMSAFDIDDYWNKSDLRQVQLNTIVKSNLRSYRYIRALNASSRGLLNVAQAAKKIIEQTSISAFSKVVTEQLVEIVASGAQSIACVIGSAAQGNVEQGRIISATGNYASLSHRPLGELDVDNVNLCRQAMLSQRSIFKNNSCVLYFEGRGATAVTYLLLLNSQYPLTNYQINLLNVFSENIASEFKNILLVERLKDLAYRDQQTGIYNSNWLIECMKSLSADALENAFLLFFDIDEYIDVSVNLGDEFAYELVMAVYKNLRQALPEQAIIAKLANDGFAVLLNLQSDEALPDSKNLCAQFLDIGGISHSATLTSAQISLKDVKNFSQKQVLSLGDSLVDIARLQHVDFLAYSADIGEAIARRHFILVSLRQDLRAGRLTVAFQPKVNMVSGAVIGCEALCRWRLNSGEVISPVEFIPVAETAGLIHELGMHILKLAIAAGEQLCQRGYDIPIAVNVSVNQLTIERNANELLAMIIHENRDQVRLEVEITESEAVEDYQNTYTLLRRLVDSGVPVSLDDFGTGYSSLAHLSKLPASALKIDKVFVDRIGDYDVDDEMVGSIVGLGHRFNYDIIAEGVETDAQKQRLIDIGCRLGQGFLFARPMALNEFIEWLEQRK